MTKKTTTQTKELKTEQIVFRLKKSDRSILAGIRKKLSESIHSELNETQALVSAIYIAAEKLKFTQKNS